MEHSSSDGAGGSTHDNASRRRSEAPPAKTSRVTGHACLYCKKYFDRKRDHDRHVRRCACIGWEPEVKTKSSDSPPMERKERNVRGRLDGLASATGGPSSGRRRKEAGPAEDREQTSVPDENVWIDRSPSPSPVGASESRAPDLGCVKAPPSPDPAEGNTREDGKDDSGGASADYLEGEARRESRDAPEGPSRSGQPADGSTSDADVRPDPLEETERFMESLGLSKSAIVGVAVGLLHRQGIPIMYNIPSSASIPAGAGGRPPDIFTSKLRAALNSACWIVVPAAAHIPKFLTLNKQTFREEVGNHALIRALEYFLREAAAHLPCEEHQITQLLPEKLPQAFRTVKTSFLHGFRDATKIVLDHILLRLTQSREPFEVFAFEPRAKEILSKTPEDIWLSAEGAAMRDLVSHHAKVADLRGIRGVTLDDIFSRGLHRSVSARLKIEVLEELVMHEVVAIRRDLLERATRSGSGSIAPDTLRASWRAREHALQGGGGALASAKRKQPESGGPTDPDPNGARQQFNAFVLQKMYVVLGARGLCDHRAREDDAELGARWDRVFRPYLLEKSSLAARTEGDGGHAGSSAGEG